MKNIVLIGMMGAGKSTVGSCLGNSLDGFSFVDMDNEIEKHAGLTIAEIFANHGESYFRTLETQLLESYSKQNSLVISTGGGIVERSENLDKMKQNCVVFYLSAPVEELFERVKKTLHRPLLNQPNPYDKIKELMKRREKYYKMADFEIETKDKEVSNIVSEIVEKYKHYGK